MHLFATGISEADSFAQLITVLLIFVLVLAITYFTTRWIANYQKSQIGNSNVQILETARIAQNKYIQILKVGRKYIVVAVTKDNVTFLTELSEEQLEHLPDLNLEVPNNFQDILQKVKEMKDKIKK